MGVNGDCLGVVPAVIEITEQRYRQPGRMTGPAARSRVRRDSYQRRAFPVEADPR